MSLAPPRGKRGRGVATVGRQPGLRHPDLDNLDDLDWGSDDGLPPAAAVAEPVNRGQEGLRDQAGGREVVEPINRRQDGPFPEVIRVGQRGQASGREAAVQEGPIPEVIRVGLRGQAGARGVAAGLLNRGQGELPPEAVREETNPRIRNSARAVSWTPYLQSENEAPITRQRGGSEEFAEPDMADAEVRASVGFLTGTFKIPLLDPDAPDVWIENVRDALFTTGMSVTFRAADCRIKEEVPVRLRIEADKVEKWKLAIAWTAVDGL